MIKIKNRFPGQKMFYLYLGNLRFYLCLDKYIKLSSIFVLMNFQLSLRNTGYINIIFEEKTRENATIAKKVVGIVKKYIIL